MKSIFTTLLFSIITSICLAQQAKTDDAVLLDYYQNQNYKAASDYLKKTYPEPINDVKVLSRLAYTAQLSKNLPEAQTYYQRIYDIDTTNQAALYSIGSIYMKRGNGVKAEPYFKRIVSRDSTNTEAFKQLAIIANNRKDTTAEVTYLQKIIHINPYDSDVAIDLGDLYISLKKLDLAATVLNKAIEGDPDNIVLAVSMLKLYYKEKKWTETIKAGQHLFLVDAGTDDTYFKMGVAYYNLKNYSCGAETLSQIKPIAQDEYSYYYLGLCYKGLKDYNQSIAMMEKSIFQGISQNIPSYYGEIADANENLGKYKKSLAAYLKGLQFKDDPTIYESLAQLYDTKLNDKATAKLYYKKAVLAYQNMLKTSYEPINSYSLASLYDSQFKDTSNAIKYYKQYLNMKPSAMQQSYINFTKSRIGQLQKGVQSN